MMSETRKKLLAEIQGKVGKTRKRSDSITFRVSPELKEKIKRAADGDRRTISQYIEILIESHFKEMP